MVGQKGGDNQNEFLKLIGSLGQVAWIGRKAEWCGSDGDRKSLWHWTSRNTRSTYEKRAGMDSSSDKAKQSRILINQLVIRSRYLLRQPSLYNTYSSQWTRDADGMDR